MELLRGPKMNLITASKKATELNKVGGK